LDHIEQEHLMVIPEADRRRQHNGEEAWRNSLAWTRKNLVMESALVGTLWNSWAITAIGYAQLRELVKSAIEANDLNRITTEALRRARTFLRVNGMIGEGESEDRQ
jgi:hypothetical protein